MLPGAFRKLLCQVVFALACVLSYLFELTRTGAHRCLMATRPCTELPSDLLVKGTGATQ